MWNVSRSNNSGINLVLTYILANILAFLESLHFLSGTYSDILSGVRSCSF